MIGRLALAVAVLLTAAPARAQDGWTRHQGAQGFVVDHPRGWVVDVPDGRTVVVRRPDGGAFALVHGFVEPAAPARDWLRGAAVRLAAHFPGASPASVQQRGQRPDQAVASFSYRGSAGESRAVLLASLLDGGGTLYAIAAPRAEFDQWKAPLVRVLRSFAFAAPAAGPPGPTAQRPPLQYTRFHDPRESAFSAEVPTGWRTSGGLARFASVDVRAVIRTTSPDDRIQVGYGDADLPPFAVPTPQMTALGFPEGSLYSPGYGVQMRVQRYLPGAAFARWYAGARMGQGLRDLAVVEVKDRPDLSRRVNGLWQESGAMRGETNFGDAAFTARWNGEAMRGYCLAGTTLVSAPGTSIWLSEHVYAYLAPADRVPTADAALARLVESFQLNPQWVAMQQGLTASVSQIVTRTHAEIARIQSTSYWSTQAAHDRLSRQRSDATLGVVRLQDPSTGQTYTAPAGSNYYLRVQGTQTVIGSDTGARPPNVDVTELSRVP